MIRRILICLFLAKATTYSINNYESAPSQPLNQSFMTLLENPNIWLDTNKRQKNSWQKDCAVQKRDNTIIKTRESLDVGAVFIASPKVRNKQACQEACCQDTKCNTAISSVKVCGEK